MTKTEFERGAAEMKSRNPAGPHFRKLPPTPSTLARPLSKARSFKLTSKFVSVQITALGMVLLACGEAFPQNAATVSVRGDLAAGYRARFRIQAGMTDEFKVPTTGMFLNVLVNQISADVAIHVLRGDGTEYRVDATNVGWETVPLPPGAATVDVELRNQDGNGGEYDLRVNEFRPPVDSDESRVAAAIESTRARQTAASRTREAIASAVGMYEHALNTWRATEDPYGEMGAQLALATLSYARTDYRNGREWAQGAFAVAHRLSDRRGEASALNNLAMCEMPLGDVRSATDHIRGAIQAFADTESFAAAAAARTNLGLLEMRTGHWADALSDYSASLMLEGRVQNPALEAVTLHNIATANIALGDLAAAASFLERARAAFVRAGDPQAAAQALATLGRVKLESGSLTEAERLLRESTRQLKELADRSAEANARNYLGQVLARRSPDEAHAEYDKARSLFEEAGDKRGESAVLLNLGNLSIAAGKLADGRSLIQQAVTIRREMGVYDLEAEAIYSLARAERDGREHVRALTDAEEALHLIEESRQQVPGEWLRSNYLSRRSEVYEFAVDLCIEISRTDPASCTVVRAFQIHEREVARSLQDRIGIGQERLLKGVSPDLVRRLGETEEVIGLRSNELLQMFSRTASQAEVSAARDKLARAVSEHRLAEEAARAASPDYRNLTTADPATISTIRRALTGDDGIVLEFSEGEAKSYLWVITDLDVHCYFLPGRDSLDRLAREFTTEIADEKQSNGPEQPSRASRELGRLLLRPLNEHPGRNRLLVVADGALAVAPLAAVQVLDSATGDFKYLIDSYEILMLPSVQSAIALRARAKRRRPTIDGVAVFADAVYSPDDERVRGARTRPSGGSGLPRLAFSKSEAEDILAVQPSKSNLKVLGFEATPDAARKAAGYRYLHFSVHAVTDAQHPEASSLVLSTVGPNGDARDGLLRLDGILDMPLRADLVVLSGCDTGTGREIRAEGILGLTQAFLYAGAREAMSSLWPVDEFNTRELMKRFYATLLKVGKTPSAALRDAQLSMKDTKAWEAPRSWAGFQVYGVSQ